MGQGELLEHFGKGETSTIFLNRNILFPDFSKKDQTYVLDILTLFEYILSIQIKMFEKMRKISIFSWTGLILCGIE